MKVFPVLTAAMLAVAVASAPTVFAQTNAPAGSNQPAQSQATPLSQNFAAMEQMMQQARATDDPHQRAELMQQHMQAMMGTMHTMMGGMGMQHGTGPHGGMMGSGHGSGHGMMHGTPGRNTNMATRQGHYAAMMQMMQQILEQQQLILNALPQGSGSD